MMKEESENTLRQFYLHVSIQIKIKDFRNFKTGKFVKY